jgi:hypothetical protein
VSDCAEIRLEMLNVYRIEADNGDEQAYINFREFVAKEIFPRRFGEDIFETVERLEQWEDIIFIRLLSTCETTLVHTNCEIRFFGIYPLLTVS